MNGDRKSTEHMLGQICTQVLVQLEINNVKKAISKYKGEKNSDLDLVEQQLDKIFGPGVNDIKETTNMSRVDDNSFNNGDDTDITDEENNAVSEKSPKKINSKHTIPFSPVSEKDNKKRKISQTNQPYTSTLLEINNSNNGPADLSKVQAAHVRSVFEKSRQDIIQTGDFTDSSSNPDDRPSCKSGSESFFSETIERKRSSKKSYTEEEKMLYKKNRRLRKKERRKEKKRNSSSDIKIVSKEPLVEEMSTVIKCEIPSNTTRLPISTSDMTSIVIDLTNEDEDDNDLISLPTRTDSVVDNILPTRFECSVITNCSKSPKCNGGDPNEVNIIELSANNQECLSQPPPLIPISLPISRSSLINEAAPSIQHYPNTVFTEPATSPNVGPSPIAATTQPKIVLIKESPKDKTKVITEKIKRWVYTYFKYYGKNSYINRLESCLKKSNLLVNLDKYWCSPETLEVTYNILRLIWLFNGQDCNIVPLMGCLMTLFRRSVDTTELSDVDTYIKFLTFSDVIKRCVLSWNKQFWKTWMFPDSFMYGCYIVDHVLYGGTSRVKSMHHLVNWSKISSIKQYFRMSPFNIPQPEFGFNCYKAVAQSTSRKRFEIDTVNKEEPSPKMLKTNDTCCKTRPPLSATPIINVRPQFNIHNFSLAEQSSNLYQPNSALQIQHMAAPSSISLHTSPFISSQPQANHVMPTATPGLINPNMRQYISPFNQYLSHSNHHASIPTHPTIQTRIQQTPARPYSYNSVYRNHETTQNIHTHYSQITSSPSLPDASSPNMPDQTSTNPTISDSLGASNASHPSDCMLYPKYGTNMR